MRFLTSFTKYHSPLLAVVCSFALGCSGGTEAKVSGRVTLDGSPVQLGNVSFEPQSGGVAALSTIDESGEYELSTNQASGLAAGPYRVKVISREKTPLPPDGGLPPPGKLLVPEKYTKVDTSGLAFDVVPGSNTIDIELKSQ